MKKLIKLPILILGIMLMLSLPVSAKVTTDRAHTPAEVDVAVGGAKWAAHFFSPVNINESRIHGTFSKTAVSFLNKEAIFAHASTILKMPNDALICAWFGGSEEGAMDTRIWYSIKEPGKKWGKAIKLEDGIDYAHWNPVLYLTEDNKVRLCYKSNGSPNDWHGYYCESADYGKTWSESKEIKFETTTKLTAGGPVKNKCFKTSKGLLLAPNSYETGDVRHAVIEYSTDDGKTWHDNGEIAARDDYGKDVKIIQPSIWESDDGSLHALLRSKNSFVYRTDSYDGGYTWCEAYRTSMINNNSGLDLTKTDDGLIWLVCNPALGIRAPLTLYVSKDDGNTWLSVMDIEKYIPLEFSYPAIIADGQTLYITYTNMRMGINCVTIKYRY